MIGSLRGRDFPISAQGYGNAYVSFCPFVWFLSLSFWLGSHLSAKALNSFLLGPVYMEKSCTGLKGHSPTRAELTWAS